MSRTSVSNYHVSKDGESGKWQVKREGADRASSSANTQRDAEQQAEQLASNSGGGEVRIHGRDGKIRDGDTVAPANDHFPPKDKKH